MKRLITNPTLQGAMQSLFSLRCRLVVASGMLGLGWLSVQAETLKLPTPAQAASAVTLPVLGTLLLSPAERRQLDAIARLAATGQGGPLPVAGAGYPAAQPEAPMFWINRRPPNDADPSSALRVLSGKFGEPMPGMPGTNTVTFGAKAAQGQQNTNATLPPGAITINRPLAAASAEAKVIGMKEK